MCFCVEHLSDLLYLINKYICMYVNLKYGSQQTRSLFRLFSVLRIFDKRYLGPAIEI